MQREWCKWQGLKPALFCRGFAALKRRSSTVAQAFQCLKRDGVFLQLSAYTATAAW
jgi:hypothetical protein